MAATTISVPRPDREREPVPFERRVAGVDDHVRRRIVRVGVHRVRAVQRARRREADVDGLEAGDEERAVGHRCGLPGGWTMGMGEGIDRGRSVDYFVGFDFLAALGGFGGRVAT